MHPCIILVSFYVILWYSMYILNNCVFLLMEISPWYPRRPEAVPEEGSAVVGFQGLRQGRRWTDHQAGAGSHFEGASRWRGDEHVFLDWMKHLKMVEDCWKPLNSTCFYIEFVSRFLQAIKAMVSEVDLDGDGEISFDEFASWTAAFTAFTWSFLEISKGGTERWWKMMKDDENL